MGTPKVDMSEQQLAKLDRKARSKVLELRRRARQHASTYGVEGGGEHGLHGSRLAPG